MTLDLRPEDGWEFTITLLAFNPETDEEVDGDQHWVSKDLWDAIRRMVEEEDPK
jgi:hypothetical protein